MTWTAGGGTRVSSSTANDTVGVYTAGGTGGSYQLHARAGGKSGLASVSIVTGPPVPGNLTVNPAQTFQTITGWEATLSQGWGVSAQGYQQLTTLAANDLGVTRIRLEASGTIIESLTPQSGNCSNAESAIGQNDNNDPNVLNPAGFTWYCFDKQVNDILLSLKQRVEARGEKFVLNVCYVGFLTGSAYQQNDPAEYAEFVFAVLDHLKTQFGLEPDIWEVRLEPDTGPFKVSGTQVGQMLLAAATRARAAGFNKVMFAVPSNANAGSAITAFSQVQAVTGTGPYQAEFTYHRYSGVTNSVLTTIAAHAQAAGVQTAMLEYMRADEHVLWQDLTLANVSSWAKYALAGPYPSATSGNQLYYADLATSQFSLRPATYFLRQYFKYVRPGYLRVGATTTLPGVEPVAFRSPGGGYVVVANVPSAQVLNVAGLPAGTYKISYSTVNALGAVGLPVTIGTGQTLTTSIPEAGTITISP
jgi:hypothetical protein